MCLAYSVHEDSHILITHVFQDTTNYYKVNLNVLKLQFNYIFRTHFVCLFKNISKTISIFFL